MRTVITETKVYKFAELSDKAKKNAINSLGDLNVDYEWWDYIYEDAEQVGIEITGFDLGRGREISGNIQDCKETAEQIIANHGETCETHKAATAFYAEIAPIVTWNNKADNSSYDLLRRSAVYDKYRQNEDNIETLEKEFRDEILQDYLTFLDKEYAYLTSEEAITESIESNDYDFTEDGKLF